MQVCERMSAEGGIVTLPVELFSTQAALQDEEGRRWLRLSVANVDNETITQVCQRLSELERLFGWELD